MAPKTIPDSFRYAVQVARDLVEDGAAERVTYEDVMLAEAALANPGRTREAELAALGEVVALGTEYLVNVDDPDDEQWVSALAGFSEASGPQRAAETWAMFVANR